MPTPDNVEQPDLPASEGSAVPDYTSTARVSYPPLRSEDGLLELTDDTLAVRGKSFSLLELEGVDVQHVRWLLWFMLGGLILAGFLIGFLQNWLRTMPAALGMTAGALLLAWGQRGTNRLRLHRLGREAQYFALPGEPAQWQKLASETNRRIRRRHDEAAQAAAALLAAQAADTLPPPPSF